MAINLNLWQRCVAHIDMCSFFPSIELLDFPELRGHPIAVTNGNSGNTIIS
ncbi:hypothetical protein [Piscirickettsia salmonis]|uniref:Y-family DNA polymerase n=1 Tax=Piscirickettsia salmonis TaxID=1238 RepID=UPI001E4FD763|nr:hypothetical protein [Piscirickettsia salmonis]